MPAQYQQRSSVTTPLRDSRSNDLEELITHNAESFVSGYTFASSACGEDESNPDQPFQELNSYFPLVDHSDRFMSNREDVRVTNAQK